MSCLAKPDPGPPSCVVLNSEVPGSIPGNKEQFVFSSRGQRSGGWRRVVGVSGIEGTFGWHFYMIWIVVQQSHVGVAAEASPVRQEHEGGNWFVYLERSALRGAGVETWSLWSSS
eukprot:93040-Pelagomonas_calceolata.AAC.3